MKNLFPKGMKAKYAELTKNIVCDKCGKIVSDGGRDSKTNQFTCTKCVYESLVLDAGVGSVWQSKNSELKLTITKIKQLNENYEVIAVNTNTRLTQFAHFFARDYTCVSKMEKPRSFHVH